MLDNNNIAPNEQPLILIEINNPLVYDTFVFDAVKNNWHERSRGLSICKLKFGELKSVQVF